MNQKLKEVGAAADLIRTQADFIISDCNHLAKPRYMDDSDAVESMQRAILNLDLGLLMLKQKFIALMFDNE